MIIYIYVNNKYATCIYFLKAVEDFLVTYRLPRDLNKICTQELES